MANRDYFYVKPFRGCHICEPENYETDKHENTVRKKGENCGKSRLDSM